jgi:hypothetical protein
MNERIRELAVQSGLEELLWIGVKGSEDAQAVEKFAELIVRECADIADGLLEDNTGSEVMFRIKEHFGVES